MRINFVEREDKVHHTVLKISIGKVSLCLIDVIHPIKPVLKVNTDILTEYSYNQ